MDFRPLPGCPGTSVASRSKGVSLFRCQFHASGTHLRFLKKNVRDGDAPELFVTPTEHSEAE